MATSIYHPMNRVINELNFRINNMPRYAGEMVQIANTYVPKMDVVLNNAFNNGVLSNVVLAPRVDAIEEANAYVIVAELAGVAKEDVTITVKDRVLTIAGEKKRPAAAEGVQFLSKGRRFGTFERSFELPENAATEGISAEFANGLLTLTVPKVAVKQPETITVEIK
jgi:HSP20 family protein